MNRFASMLECGLRSNGNIVSLIRPPPIFGRISALETGLGKWLGYFDRFLFFLPYMKIASNWADVVHICDQANAVYIPYLKQKPHIITCHDMLAVRCALGEIPQITIGPTGRAYQKWIMYGLKKACHVTCVSRFTYDHLLRLTGISSSKVSVVRNGLNYRYQRMSEEESLHHLKQLGLSDCRPFFFHVGNNNWYKNKIGVLKIFKQLLGIDKCRRPKLVLAGKRLDDHLQLFADKIGISDHIRQTGEVSNEQLRALYSSADGLLFPSLTEGFGWPIIEAQACGCLVFTSNTEPMPEVGGSAAIYFNPFDEVSAARSIWNAIQNNTILREYGYQNAVKYSTQEMISGYIDCYRLVMQK